MQFVRLTVTIPRLEFERIERTKKKLGLNRSALLKTIIDFFFQKEDEKEKIARYEAGYSENPEDLRDIHHLEKTQIETLGAYAK